jgi:hypothetical protein
MTSDLSQISVLRFAGLLDDPIIQLVMEADHVDKWDLVTLLDQASARLKRQDLPSAKDSIHAPTVRPEPPHRR